MTSQTKSHSAKVLVSKSVLSLVLNALDRDAANGLMIRAEIAAELRSSIEQTRMVNFDQALSDNSFYTNQLLERAAKCMGVDRESITLFDVVGHLESLTGKE